MSIDFHTHILPGVDDGSRNVEISLAMLEEESRQAFDSMSIEEHMAYYEDRGISRKEAMKLVAKDRGLSKREIYQALL